MKKNRATRMAERAALIKAKNNKPVVLKWKTERTIGMNYETTYVINDDEVEVFVKRVGKLWEAFLFDGCSDFESFGRYPTRKAAMKKAEEALALYRRLYPKTGS